MKTIIANASSGFFGRNFLRTDAPAVLAAQNVRMVVLVPAGKLEFYRREFAELANVVFDVLPDTRRTFWESVFEFIDHSAVHTKTTRLFHLAEFWKKGTSRPWPLRVLRLIARRALWVLGGFPIFIKFLRWFYYRLPSNYYGDIFSKYKPDAVFCPTSVYHDQLILKEAKKSGLKTIGMVLSWDNLYTKTFLRVFPDQLLVQTEIVKNQAIELGYPESAINIIGIPQYDIYFKREKILPRDAFIRGLGGDPSKKLLVYAFSGKAALHIEFKILELLHRAIAEKKITGEVQVLVRPYPRFDFPPSKLEEIKQKYGFLVTGATEHVGGSDNDWEFGDASIELLINTVAHADIIIAIYTTFFIEGAIFDKPLVAPAFDGDKNYDYWNSAVRFFDWEHLERLGRTNGVRRVMNFGDLVAAINEYLKNPSFLSEGRRKIVLEQCQFTDGKSGERLGRALIQALSVK
jgi:hypothetical protein